MSAHLGQGFIRIIGGKYKGRRLKVASSKVLRPTPNRIRETLFNWLSVPVKGARCLDLFAGTGALGFEALSRGAAELILIEKHSGCLKQLETACHELNCKAQTQIFNKEALQWLKQTASYSPFDIIFIDPPFNENLWPPTLASLIKYHHIHESSLIYLEAPSTWQPADHFNEWTILKSQSAGEVSYYLIKMNKESQG